MILLPTNLFFPTVISALYTACSCMLIVLNMCYCLEAIGSITVSHGTFNVEHRFSLRPPSRLPCVKFLHLLQKSSGHCLKWFRMPIQSSSEIECMFWRRTIKANLVPALVTKGPIAADNTDQYFSVTCSSFTFCAIFYSLTSRPLLQSICRITYCA